MRTSVILMLGIWWAVADLSAQVLGPPSPHGDIEINCDSCHTTSQWVPLRKPFTFDHGGTGFPLVAAHAETDCRACHESLQFELVSRDCAACHLDIHQAKFGEDCASCHVDTAWEVRVAMLQRHEMTRFPLLGQHARLECEACHENQTRHEFSFTPVACEGCHARTFDQTTSPNHKLANFPEDCQQCHRVTANTWEEATFAHPPTFPLALGHAGMSCEICHVSTYEGTSPDCVSCHMADFQATADPDHETNNFTTDCHACHNTADWVPATFEHDQSGFPLTGAHQTIDCVACHVEGYGNLPRDCNGCHAEDFEGTSDPRHLDPDFSRDCTQCHGTVAWTPSSFQHVTTGYTLRGAHQSLDCAACHEIAYQGYAGTPQDCFGCHESDFEATQDPNHATGGFSQDCTQCHTETAWSPAEFDHNQTQFPLTGAHMPLDCQSCHESGFTGTPSECVACHESDFLGVSDPNHVANGFDRDCTVCHETSAWDNVFFDHANTAFPLTGAHAPLDCLACHEAGYDNTPSDCLGCHEQDYNAAQDPNHVASQFSTDCTDCHNTDAWSPAFFDHNQSQFPLTGAHQPLDCVACHAEGYTNTPTDCFACHESDYNEVSDPNHVTNNFSTDCTQCHTTDAWTPSFFDHNQTQFPLTGAHQPLDCVACHAEGYTNTPTDCFACHESDYTGVVDPNHVTNNFSTDCLVCHTTSAWTPASFDHNQTQFPLTGAHQPLDCVACHAGGYANTPTQCFACHEDDYLAAVDPNHSVAGFPTTCEDCHTTIAWSPATFNHMFPIYNGSHAGEWNACTDCHINASNFAEFSCTVCHEHNQADMDEDHEGVAGYVYETSACYSCHPNGEQD